MTPDLPGGAVDWRARLKARWLTPAPTRHTPTRRELLRRRWAAGLTLVVGALVLAWSLRQPAGGLGFYAGTLGMAIVWVVGAFAAGPLHLGREPGFTRADRARFETHPRPIIGPLVVGLLLLALFLVGALVVAHIPLLREPVEGLLAHARVGSLALVAVLTAVNGLAEELYFRGALFDAIPPRYAVALTTVVYAAVTAGAGIPLLVLAAALLGIVTGVQRRVTGGILAPTITHLTWSLGMLFLLPLVLDAAR